TYPETFNAFSCPVSIRYLLNFYQETKWADIIYYHYPWPFADILPLVFPIKKPQIVTYHSDIVKQKWLKTLLKPVDTAFLGKMNKIIATSKQYADTSSNLKNLSHKVKVIPICLDKTLYPKPRLSESRKITHKFGQNFLLFIGQLRYYKGLHLLIEVMREINTNLVIIGTGPLEQQLQHMIRKLSIKNVFFIGSVDEQTKVNYLYSCYSVILPSHLRSEAFGISLLEGCMFGKPLISCKIGTGTEYVNIDTHNGFVAEPNSQSLKNAMNKLLQNPSLAKTMGENSLKRFNSSFSIDMLGKELKIVIDSMVHK
ncbi:MAG: glycosyltransferase, partial [Rickettsiales bacterium]|nr:glycosyltransferase [Rickettsiales bacterium]